MRKGQFYSVKIKTTKTIKCVKNLTLMSFTVVGLVEFHGITVMYSLSLANTFNLSP